MIRALSNRTSNGWRKLIWFLWSWALPIMIIAIIGLKFTNNKEAATMLKSVDLVNGLGILFCLALLPLNVGIEAWKWQRILKPIQQPSVWRCMKTILLGKSLNVVTPFGVGDGFSRYLGLTKINRDQIFSGLAIDRISQLLPTLSFGVMSVLFLFRKGLDIPMNELSIAFGIAVSLAAMLVSCLIYFLEVKLVQYLTILMSLDFKSIVMIGGLSVWKVFRVRRPVLSDFFGLSIFGFLCLPFFMEFFGFF